MLLKNELTWHFCHVNSRIYQSPVLWWLVQSSAWRVISLQTMKRLYVPVPTWVQKSDRSDPITSGQLCIPTWHSHVSPVTTCDQISLPLLYGTKCPVVFLNLEEAAKTRLADRKGKEEETINSCPRCLMHSMCIFMDSSSPSPWTKPAWKLWETSGDEENNKSHIWEGILNNYIIHRIQHHIFSLLWGNFPNKITEELKCKIKKNKII